MIKIGGYKIYAFLKNNLLLKREHLGEYHPTTQKIIIEKKATTQQKRETFMHEMLEAINSIYEMQISHDKLTLLATVLHQVFTDNEIEKYFKYDNLEELPTIE